jgi:hypothetical protein
MASRGLALSGEQIETLKTVVGLLPPDDKLRGRFSEMLSEALRNRDSIGEGELARLARDIAGELLARDARERFRAQPRKQERADLKGFEVSL